MPEKKIGCARPTGGLVGESAPRGDSVEHTSRPVQGGTPMIQVGRKAPDFSAPAYVNGEFSSVSLSEYLGSWVALCFYPGDFTFV